jgi:hypothetical protein
MHCNVTVESRDHVPSLKVLVTVTVKPILVEFELLVVSPVCCKNKTSFGWMLDHSGKDPSWTL